jgi:hypothetical protein
VSIVSGTIEVEASLPAVYRWWTRFEDFPAFKRLVEARGLETGASRGDVPPRGARTDD